MIRGRFGMSSKRVKQFLGGFLLDSDEDGNKVELDFEALRTVKLGEEHCRSTLVG